MAPPDTRTHIVLETIYKEPKNVDFRNQSTLFPFVPEEANGFAAIAEAIEICLHPEGTQSLAFLINNCFLLGLFSIIACASLTTLVFMWLKTKHTGRRLKLFRRIERSEGTYFAVENGTWVPFTMFLYCIALIGQQVAMIETTYFIKSQINLMLWRFMPFTILFLQGHFFAFSMLIGGIITTDEIWIYRKLRTPKPWVMNFCQFSIALIMTATTIYYTIEWNQWTNYTWITYQSGEPLWRDAADTWVEGQPLNTDTSIPAFKAYKIHMTVLYTSLDYAKKVWIVWLFSSCLPLVTLSAAAGLLLKAVRSHINDVLTVQDHTATIITIPVPTMSMSEEAVTEAPEWNSKKNSQFFKCNSSISNIGKSLSSGNKENEDNKNTEVGRSIQRMRRIEKTLVVRIASVLSVVTVHAALVIAFLTQHRVLRRHRQFLALAITFPWVSAIYGSLVIGRSLYCAIKEYQDSKFSQSLTQSSKSDYSLRGSSSRKTTSTKPNQESFLVSTIHHELPEEPPDIQVCQ